jgi:branched-chain amino acid transport system ATP-binding protein
MLVLDEVHAHYGLSHILQGISMTVESHEIVGLFGRNGVGKTTILRTIAGWVAPSSGRLVFNNEEIGSLPPNKIAKRGIGLVPEDRRIFPGLTVEENLKLGLGLGIPRKKKEASQSLERIYQRFPRLAERRCQSGVTLSGGEQQMLAIARVLVGNPRMLLIDEPTEGLAPMIVDEIFQLIGELKNDGIPIILVEQNVSRALDGVDRFYAVERGRICYSGHSSIPAEREELYQIIAV